MVRISLVLLSAALAGVAAYAPRPSAPSHSRLAVASSSRARPLAVRADHDDVFDLFTPEPEQPAQFQLAARTRASAARRLAPLGALRRSVSRFVASVLATLLSGFFFGTQAFAATSSTASSSVAAGALQPLVGAVFAAAGVSAAVVAQRRMAIARAEADAADAAAAAAQAIADSEPPKLDEDALMMSSLRNRMLNLGNGRADADAGGEEDGVLDDELDDLERTVREQRARYPVNRDADRRGTATLEPPQRDSDGDADGDADAPPRAPAPGEPKLADAATIALLEKLFNGGDGAPAK
ncbi:hypothetical protein KFE25_002429 [Diacronema lutheri]|uniref:Transmembrane protein n=1 Tax=Diacronema lutheri TaxID=2081491 RepID=A0A8J6C959_DIALT|nr:hypothetical protein KFE25_002429 [Diacronema lutheri]